MSLLFKILYAAHASGTHHKLALDALHHLRGPDAEAWRKVFLKHAETYLEGSKAPDKQFKDFTNHVLHVRDGYWGGAAEKAMNWYAHLVEALQAHNWADAVYAAGVLSHYYTDPIMPFHTAQSEAENNIHRAAEWSISKSYNDLHRLAKTAFPAPDVPIEDRDDWLADLVCDAAEISNSFYETLISNYDLDKGVVDPPSGLNDRARRIVAQLLAYAQVGQARILERAFAEANVAPPDVELNVTTVIAGLKIPVKWVVRKIDDAKDRAAVTAMYDELQHTGTVEKTLAEDDRAVRERFRKEVGDTSASPRPEFRPPHIGGAFDYAKALKQRSTSDAADGKAGKEPKQEENKQTKQSAQKDVATGTQSATMPEAAKSMPTGAAKPDATGPKSGPEDEIVLDAAGELRNRAAEMEAALDNNVSKDQSPAKSKAGSDNTKPEFRLHLEDEVEDGPSVGPKTALRLNKVGIVTVADLLKADADKTAKAVDVSYIRAKTIIDWQDQARLQCEVPALSGTASQLIVGAGFRTRAELANASIIELRAAVEAFAKTSDGERILRDRPVPEKARMERWIANAVLASADKDARSAA